MFELIEEFSKIFPDFESLFYWLYGFVTTVEWFCSSQDQHTATDAYAVELGLGSRMELLGKAHLNR